MYCFIDVILIPKDQCCNLGWGNNETRRKYGNPNLVSILLYDLMEVILSLPFLLTENRDSNSCCDQHTVVKQLSKILNIKKPLKSIIC